MDKIVFYEGDVVDWDYLDSMVPGFLKEHGKGPFYVVKIKPTPKDQLCRAHHPQLLIISKDEERRDVILGKWSKDPVEFSGDFFRKLSSKELKKLLKDNANEEYEGIIAILTNLIGKSRIIFNRGQLEKIGKIYCFCYNLNGQYGQSKQFSEELFHKGMSLELKASLIEDALEYSKEIAEILQTTIKNRNLLKIKVIYNYARGLCKK